MNDLPQLTEYAVGSAASAAALFGLYGTYRVGRWVISRPAPWWAMASVVLLAVSVFGWHQAWSQQDPSPHIPDPPTISESNPPHIVEARMSDWKARCEVWREKSYRQHAEPGLIPTAAAWPLAIAGLFAGALCFARSMVLYAE